MGIKSYAFEIEGRLESMNKYIDACRMNPKAGNTMYANSKAKVIKALVDYGMTQFRFEKPVYLKYIWVEENKKRDLDNISGYGHKVIQDALVDAKIIPNDGWKNIKGFSDEFRVSKEHPRIIVCIKVEDDD